MEGIEANPVPNSNNDNLEDEKTFPVDPNVFHLDNIKIFRENTHEGVVLIEENGSKEGNPGAEI